MSTEDTDTVERTIRQARVQHVEFKAAVLLALLLALLLGAAAFLLYARGAFEPTQELVLIADDSEGVTIGMDLTFSGFPIGRVRRVGLGDDGSVRIWVDVRSSEARWLRESSVFTLERSLVGATRLRAFTGMMEDPPLPDGAERTVLKGDAMADLPRIVIQIRDLMHNLQGMTAEQAPLNASLRNVQRASETLTGPQGALGLLVGNPEDRARFMQVIDESNALLRRLEAVAARAESLVGNADQRVFGADGLMTDTQAAVRQIEGLLADARQSLQKVDAVLVEAQGIAQNTRTATVDLDQLRVEVEANLRRIDALLSDLSRRWPLARDTELRVP